MKLIYVASPYAGEVEKNMEFAKKACRFCVEQGHAFFAPHLLYPQLLDDRVQAERQTGLDMGIAMLPRCDELWCYGGRISLGMHSEMEEADRLGIPVRRVREMENGFVIGAPEGVAQTEAPAPVMRMY